MFLGQTDLSVSGRKQKKSGIGGAGLGSGNQKTGRVVTNRGGMSRKWSGRKGRYKILMGKFSGTPPETNQKGAKTPKTN